MFHLNFQGFRILIYFKINMKLLFQLTNLQHCRLVV